jgi:putative serine protease PepD
MAIPPPSSLWADPDRENARHPWLEATVVTPPPPAPAMPPPPPPRRPSRLRRAAGLLLVAAVAVIASVATVSILDRTDGDGQRAGGTVKPLPASTGRASATRINEIYDRVSASVVSVEVRSGSRGGSGTGFVIDTDGTIVTNAHVAEGANNGQVQVRFDDNGESIPARVVGTDASSDLAVLKVNPGAAPKLVALPLAESDQVKVGDAAIAIGFPLGLDKTATAGIVSGLGREIKAPNGFTIDKVIQTDAPINPGNSGGPLLDDRGRVIGVNSQIATAGSNGNVGIGFAVPSNTVREVVPRLERGETIQRPWLGVSTTDPRSGDGAAIAEVTPGGPADRAGLEGGAPLTGQGGDVIVSIDGKAVAAPDDVSEHVGAKRPGDRVRVEIERDGSRRTVEVELGVRPAQARTAP